MFSENLLSPSYATQADVVLIKNQPFSSLFKESNVSTGFILLSFVSKSFTYLYCYFFYYCVVIFYVAPLSRIYLSNAKRTGLETSLRSCLGVIPISLLLHVVPLNFWFFLT